MSGFRGFGFTITAGGVARYWYVGKDGIKRWSDTDLPVTSEADYLAAMSAGIPPIGTPDPIAADEAEHGVCALPMTPDEEAEQVNLRG